MTVPVFDELVRQACLRKIRSLTDGSVRDPRASDEFRYKNEKGSWLRDDQAGRPGKQITLTKRKSRGYEKNKSKYQCPNAAWCAYAL